MCVNMDDRRSWLRCVLPCFLSLRMSHSCFFDVACNSNGFWAQSVWHTQFWVWEWFLPQALHVLRRWHKEEVKLGDAKEWSFKWKIEGKRKAEWEVGLLAEMEKKPNNDPALTFRLTEVFENIFFIVWCMLSHKSFLCDDSQIATRWTPHLQSSFWEWQWRSYRTVMVIWVCLSLKPFDTDTTTA